MTLASPNRLVALVALDDAGQPYTISVRARAVAVIGEAFPFQQQPARMILIGGLPSGPSLVILNSRDNLAALRADDDFVLVDAPHGLQMYVRPELPLVIGAPRPSARSGERVLPLHFRGLDMTIEVLDTPTNRVKLRIPSTPASEILYGSRD